MVTKSNKLAQPSELPLSETSFNALRRHNMVYVDKTARIYEVFYNTLDLRN